MKASQLQEAPGLVKTVATGRHHSQAVLARDVSREVLQRPSAPASAKCHKEQKHMNYSPV